MLTITRAPVFRFSRQAYLNDSIVASAEQRALQPAKEYVWGDLALLWKGGTGYAVEPHTNGGTCVATFSNSSVPPTYFINDILGITLAIIRPDRIEVVPMTAFVKPLHRLASQPACLPKANLFLQPTTDQRFPATNPTSKTMKHNPESHCAGARCHRDRSSFAAIAVLFLVAAGNILPLSAKSNPEPTADNLSGLGVQPVEYFYTGKPYDADTESYTFKFRSYDPELNRWTTADPSGFPDGANNHLYGRSPLSGVDPNGLAWGLLDYVWHFVLGGGQAVSLSHIGYLDGVQSLARAPGGGVYNFGDQIAGKADDLIKPYNGEFHESFTKSYNFGSVSWPLGNGTLAGYYIGNMTSTPNPSPEPGGTYDYNGVASIAYSDMFTDPYDIIQLLYESSTSEDVPPFLLAAANGIWIPGMPGFYIQGTPYAIIDS